jgi:hypothetical protein
VPFWRCSRRRRDRGCSDRGRSGNGPRSRQRPGPAGLDAGLFALIDEAREAGARVEAAIGALEQATERTEEVPWPQALIVTS